MLAVSRVGASAAARANALAAFRTGSRSAPRAYLRVLAVDPLDSSAAEVRQRTAHGVSYLYLQAQQIRCIA